MKLCAKINQETASDLPKQHVYYSSGIGTRPKSSNVLGRAKDAVSDTIDMAVAWFVAVKNASLFNRVISFTTGIWKRLSRMRIAGSHECIKKGIRFISLVGLALYRSSRTRHSRYRFFPRCISGPSSCGNGIRGATGSLIFVQNSA